MKSNKMKILSVIGSNIIIGSSILTPAFVMIANNKNNVVNSIKLSDKQIIEKFGISTSQEEVNTAYIKELYESNVLLKDSSTAKYEIVMDSHQQSDRMHHENPTATKEFTFERSVSVSPEVLLSASLFNKPGTILYHVNNNSRNTWKYNIGAWNSWVDKRFVGCTIIMPFWADRVSIYHNAKTYDSINLEKFSKERKFMDDLYWNNIRTTLYESIFVFVKKDISENNPGLNKDKLKDLTKEKTDELMETVDGIVNHVLKDKGNPKYQPRASAIGEEFEKNHFASFGNINVLYNDSIKRLSFKTNLSETLSEYSYKESCTGPTCSHNIRHLGDVIWQPIKELLAKLLGTPLGQVILTLVGTAILNKTTDFEIYKIFLFLNRQMSEDKFGGALTKFTNYITRNRDDCLLRYFGKADRHGIQLGKCGNIYSGINIAQADNIREVNNDKPISIYSGELDKFFNDEKTDYDYVVLHCVSELSKYKEIYNYLLTLDIPKNVFNIFKTNITNQSKTTDEIYDDLDNYLSHNIIPSSSSIKNDLFKNFEDKGWRVPKLIQSWDLLEKQVLPSLLNDKIGFESENEDNVITDKHYFFDHGKFSNEGQRIRNDNIYIERMNQNYKRFHEELNE